MNTGNRISTYRKKLGLSQEQLAEKLNVSRQTVSKWESNTHLPELDKCIELCRIFNISLDELLLGETLKDTGLSEEQFDRLIQEVKQPVSKKRKYLKYALGIALVASLFKIYLDYNYLNHELMNLSNQLNYLSYEVQNQSSNIYDTIQDALQSNDSIISNFKYQAIHYDLEKEEVFVQLQVYPKNMNQNSEMKLEFSNEYDRVNCELKRKDNYFEGEFLFPLNDFDSLLVLMNDQNNLRQMTFNPYLDLLSDISLNCSFGFPENDIDINKKTNTLIFSFSALPSFIFDDVSRQVSMNGSTIESRIESSDYEIYLNDQFHSTIQTSKSKDTHFEIKANNNDKISIVLHYQDSIGLHYRETVDCIKVINRDNQMSFERIVESDSIPNVSVK